MKPEDCVDAALAGLDLGEEITRPSMDEPALVAAYDDARAKLFTASRSGNAAGRYSVA